MTTGTMVKRVNTRMNEPKRCPCYSMPHSRHIPPSCGPSGIVVVVAIVGGLESVGRSPLS